MTDTLHIQINILRIRPEGSKILELKDWVTLREGAKYIAKDPKLEGDKLP